MYGTLEDMAHRLRDVRVHVDCMRTATHCSSQETNRLRTYAERNGNVALKLAVMTLYSMAFPIGRPTEQVETRTIFAAREYAREVRIQLYLFTKLSVVSGVLFCF